MSSAMLVVPLLLLLLTLSTLSTAFSMSSSLVPPTNLILSTTGDKMPSIGFGCWKLGPSSESLVHSAIASGWRHIDSASDYGNELAVGRGIASAMKELSLPREALFVTSKLWNTYHHPDHVEAACRRTLKDLGLSYLDLYLIHFPIPLKFVPFETRYPPEWIHDPTAPNPTMVPADPGFTLHDTWKAMESLVAKGLVRNIGVANFNAALLLELLRSARLPPACNQIELHPHHSQRGLVDFCRRKGIAVTAFSPLASAGYREIGMDQCEGLGLLESETIRDVARRKGKSPAQVLLRWGVQRGTAVIPKTSSVGRMVENIDVFDFSLEEEDMEAIYKLNLNRRYNDPGVFAVGMGGDYPIYL